MYQEFKTLISPITTTHQMLYQKLKSIPSSLLVLPHNDQAYVLYDKHTDARLVSVCCVYTLHIGAVSSVRGVLRTTGLGPGQGGGAETRRGPTTLLPSSNPSHPTTCQMSHPALHCPPGVPQCTSSPPLLLLPAQPAHNTIRRHCKL